MGGSSTNFKGPSDRLEEILYEQLEFFIAHAKDCDTRECQTCDLYKEAKWVLLGIFDTEERSIEKQVRLAVMEINDAIDAMSNSKRGNGAEVWNALQAAKVRLNRSLGEPNC